MASTRFADSAPHDLCFCASGEGGEARGFPARNHRLRFRVPRRACSSWPSARRPACRASPIFHGPRDWHPRRAPRPTAAATARCRVQDVLLVTWTVDEGHALSRVLTPGKDSHNDYLPYTHNFAKISTKMRKGCPAIQAKRLGAYWTTTIGKKSVVVFKSDSHMSQDGPQLPEHRRVASDHPGSAAQAGDHDRDRGRDWETVRGRRRDREPHRPVRLHREVQEGALREGTLHQLSAENHAFRPRHGRSSRRTRRNSRRTTQRPPKIVRVPLNALGSSVVTTDFFGFDTSDDHYKLQGLGDVSEMGDAVLGLVASTIGTRARRAGWRSATSPTRRSRPTA